MHEITLRAMRFHTLVGILPHERTVAQPIEIDLDVQVTDGEGVVDYAALYDIVARVVLPGPVDYLEDIGERIATDVLEHSSRIRSARVAVRKPHVALGGPLDFAQIVVVRNADD